MHSENVRLRLLDVGEKIIHEQGFNGTGIQQITQQADVPKGSFYNHFPSKEVFAVEVIQHHWASPAFQFSLMALDDLHAGNARQRLRQHFTRRMDNHEAEAFRSGCLLGNLASEMADQSEMIRLRLSATNALWATALSDCIRQGQASGELLGNMEAHASGNALLDAWQGAVTRSKLTRNRMPFDHFLSRIFGPMLA